MSQKLNNLSVCHISLKLISLLLQTKIDPRMCTKRSTRAVEHLSAGRLHKSSKLHCTTTLTISWELFPPFLSGALGPSVVRLRKNTNKSKSKDQEENDEAPVNPTTHQHSTAYRLDLHQFKRLWLGDTAFLKQANFNSFICGQAPVSPFVVAH